MNTSSINTNGATAGLLSDPVNLVSKTGPLFLSALFHWGLFGVLCTQFLIYVGGYPKDPLRNKLFVYTIVTLEVVQTTILTKSYFDVFGYGFGDQNSYDNIGAIWFSVPFLSGIVAFLAELFYAMRLYRLSQSYMVPMVVCGLTGYRQLAVIQVAGAISNAIVVKDAGLFSLIPEKGFRIAAGAWAGASALCDVVIAYFMTRYVGPPLQLWQRRSDGMNPTQAIVNRIIRLVLETGTVTALVAVLLLVFTLLPNHASYYQIPASILAKLYSNSMLALLNSRSNLNANKDIECQPIAPATSLTVLRFVETYQEPGVAPAKPHNSYAHSVDERSV
ncbi:hypothetical protein D9619_012861 [Psilocybe cf. subviscida]|uniref:DUF6534 domain-containing protein n=1 Tax=Psilocybe cf. subviscida TaxID=2480587 RepID=A0A8H5F4N4_9AGAR|nr:hypothetical protein D9619_012861 [Psilocybe cf. subviscida]